MSALPTLPARVENAQHLAELVSVNPDSWYASIKAFHDFATNQSHQIDHLDTELATKTSQNNELLVQIKQLQEQRDNKIRDHVTAHNRVIELKKDLQQVRSARDELASVTKYQEEKIKTYTKEILQLH